MQSTVAVPEQYLGLSFTERKDGNVYLFLRERMEKTFLVVLKRLAASQQSCTVPGRGNIWNLVIFIYHGIKTQSD